MLTAFFCTGILLCVFYLYGLYRVKQIETLYPPVGSFVQVEGSSVHYVSKGTGPEVVLVHGGFGSVQDYYLSLFEKLPEKFHCVAIDRAGHGYSQRPSSKHIFTLDDHTEYLKGAIDALGIRRPVLVGHSLGSAVVLNYALKYAHDTAGLLLIGPYVRPWRGWTNPMHTMAAVPILGPIYLHCFVLILGLFFKHGIGDKVFYPDDPPKDYLEVSTALAMRPAHFAANAEDICRLRPLLKRNWQRYKDIEVPVLILSGDQDRIAPLKTHAQPLAEQIPSAELIVLKNVGHQPSFVCPDEVLNALRRLREKNA